MLAYRCKSPFKAAIAILLGIATNLWIVVFAASNFGNSNENWTWFPGPEWQIDNARCVSDETRTHAVIIDLRSFQSLVTTTHSATIRCLGPVESKVFAGDPFPTKAFDPSKPRVIAPTDIATDYRLALLPWGASRAWPRWDNHLDGEFAEVEYNAGVALFGIPFRCAWGEWTNADSSMVPTMLEMSVPWRNSPLIIPDHWSALPTIANSVVLALAWRGLFALPSAACSLLRGFTRRGCCIRCGYSRAGLRAASPCPECGPDHSSLC